MHKKITIVGRGVDPAKHLTLSAINALRLSKKIIGIESEKEFWSKLQKELSFSEIEYVNDMYHNNTKDSENYSRFIEHVLFLSSKYDHISLLVAGHPLFGVSFIKNLKNKIPIGTEIEIIEGISSFDSMLTLLDIDPLEQGTVLIDANRLLLFKYTIEQSLCYFIYHVCSVGNPNTNFLDPSQGNRIDILQNYLSQFYSLKKEVKLCKAANGKNQPSFIFNTTLENLDKCLQKIDFSTTLFLESEKPKNFDREYFELLR